MEIFKNEILLNKIIASLKKILSAKLNFTKFQIWVNSQKKVKEPLDFQQSQIIVWISF